MPVPALLLLAVLALPLIEIAVFIWVGGMIGLWPTLSLVVLSAVLGIVVLRSTGRSVVTDSRRALAEGTLPGRAIGDAMLVGIAGVLLLVPGFLTDTIALLLLFPPTREALYRLVTRNMRSSTVIVTNVSARDTQPGPAPRTIDLDSDDWRAS